MGITLVATSIVCITSILVYIGLASIIVIAPIKFHAIVSLTLGVVTAATVIAVVIVATHATFKRPTGQVLSGCLLL